MGLYPDFARHVLAPAYDRVRGTRTMQCLRELEQSQWWPAERIHELQSQRLQHLIEYAYERVPHYHRVMEERSLVPSDIRTAADLVALPVLTRRFVQEHREDFVAEGFPRGRLRVTRTSGSTGVPLQFYSTREDQLNRGLARAARARGWAGLALGDRSAVVSRPRVYSKRRERLLASLSQHFQRTVFIDVENLSDEVLLHVVDRLAAAAVRGLRGYPGAIALLAACIRDAGITAPLVHCVITGGEQLADHERRLIRDVFGTEPYSQYSSYEVFEIAGECGAHEGMHIAAEDVIVEVVDEAGTPVPPGVEGRILVTNLHNYGMPFIRYDLGDSGMLVDGACSCGRTLPRLGALIGRWNDYFVTRSGRRIFSGALFFNRLAGLGMRQYQVIQETLDTVVMKLVPPKGATAADLAVLRARVIQMYQSRFGDEFTFHVEFVERIEPTEAGKHKFMLSRVRGVGGAQGVAGSTRESPPTETSSG